MEIIRSESKDKKPSTNTSDVDKEGAAKNEDVNPEKENVFSEENLTKPSDVVTDESTIVIDPIDKVAFIDSIVNNTRFKKSYDLFGGNVKVVLRSLTNDEVSALSCWIAKQGVSDSAGLVSGRYRKYLLAAHVEQLNGVNMPALEEPLFETLGSDGKTIKKPGWTDRSLYWDNVPIGLFNAVIHCVEKFDSYYAQLCTKAEDSNFWNPDTP